MFKYTILLMLLAKSALADVGVFAPSLLSPRFPIAKLEGLSPSSVAILVKSFGNHWDNLDRITNTTKTVIVYLDCGPCRDPRRPKGQFNLMAPGLNIAQLNRALERRHPRVISAIDRHIARVAARLPKDKGVSYVIVPSLEDNFTDDAYSAMRELVATHFSSVGRIVRNPLKPKRYESDGLEIHSYSVRDIAKLRSGDIINGDGVASCLSTKCSESEMVEKEGWVRAAIGRGVIPLIYVPQIQGLPASIKQGGVSFIPPEERTYSIPNIKQLERLIRYGQYIKGIK